jgi:hypothetical protein
MPSIESPMGKAQQEAMPNAASRPPAASTVLTVSPPACREFDVMCVSVVMATGYTL